ILAFEGEGRVVYHVGNYDYYLEKRGASDPIRDSYPAPAGAAAEQRKAKTNRGSLSGKKSVNGRRWRRIFSLQKTRCRIWRPRLPHRIFMRNRERRFSSWRRN